MKPILAKELLKEPPAAVGNSGDPEQVKRAERKENDEVSRDKQDIMFLIQQPEFSRWLWRLLKNCGFEENPMSIDPHRSYFSMGQQSIAQAIVKEIDAIDPAYYADIRVAAKQEELNGR